MTDNICVSYSAISLELKRNIGQLGFGHKQVQDKAIKRREAANKRTEMPPALVALVESKNRLGWSPE
jgi:IS30 family transposase